MTEAAGSRHLSLQADERERAQGRIAIGPVSARVNGQTNPLMADQFEHF